MFCFEPKTNVERSEDADKLVPVLGSIHTPIQTALWVLSNLEVDFRIFCVWLQRCKHPEAMQTMKLYLKHGDTSKLRKVAFLIVDRMPACQLILLSDSTR